MSEPIKVGDLVTRNYTEDGEDSLWYRLCERAGVDPLQPVEVVGLTDSGTTVTLKGLGGWCTKFFTLQHNDEEDGIKFDGEKPRVDLLIDGCPLAIEAISKVLTFGAKKYSDHNWQKVENGEQRYKAAMMRHVLASAKGEKVDSETGLSHLAHAACCVLFMLELELKKDA